MLKRDENTTVFCANCHQPHPARYVEREVAMFLVPDCTRGAREARVSHDAQCFQVLRERVPELKTPCARRPHIFFCTSPTIVHCAVRSVMRTAER